MARRRQFLQLVYDLRAELRKSVDPAAGVADLPVLKRTIQRNYETLYDEYDWPHLTVIPTKMDVSAGQRYHEFPDGITYDMVETVVVWWNGDPVPLARGIGFEHYAEYDSEEDDRTDPLQRWDVRFTGVREQIEVWPLPASATQIQIKAKKQFAQLVDDDDLCLIDDHLLLLTCAVELAPKDQNVQVKLAALQQRMHRLKTRAKAETGSVKIGLGRGGNANYDMPRKAVIRIGG